MIDQYAPYHQIQYKAFPIETKEDCPGFEIRNIHINHIFLEEINLDDDVSYGFDSFYADDGFTDYEVEKILKRNVKKELRNLNNERLRINSRIKSNEIV